MLLIKLGNASGFRNYQKNRIYPFISGQRDENCSIYVFDRTITSFYDFAELNSIRLKISQLSLGVFISGPK